MSLLPTDLPSFLWGAVIAGVAAFGTGFLKKAGEHAYKALHSKFFPEPLGPVEIDRQFSPSMFRTGGCAWVSELDVGEFEDKGYTHYPHPSGAPKCFRMTSDGRRMFKEFLMVRPDAERAV